MFTTALKNTLSKSGEWILILTLTYISTATISSITTKEDYVVFSLALLGVTLVQAYSAYKIFYTFGDELSSEGFKKVMKILFGGGAILVVLLTLGLNIKTGYLGTVLVSYIIYTITTVIGLVIFSAISYAIYLLVQKRSSN